MNFSSSNSSDSNSITMDLQHQLLASGFGLTAALHAVGLILLYKANDNDLPNQRWVTMNLATTEMIFCLWSICRYLWFFFAYKEYFKHHLLIMFIDTHLYTIIKFAILHIIIDRFLYIYMNIKYSVYVTKKVLIITNIMQWLVSIILNMTLTLNKASLVSCYAYLFVDIIIIITTVASFMYILLKIRNINKTVSSRKRKDGLLKIWLKLKIPTLMVLSYISFNGSSTVMKVYYATYKAFDLVVPATIIDLCGYLSDVLCYIFLQKRIRSLLVPRKNKGK